MSASVPVDGGARIAQLGRMLSRARSGRMTVEELAEAAGVSSGLISQLERGMGNPSFSTLMRLSQALGLPISAFFQGDDEHDPERIIVRREERRNLVMADGLGEGPGLEQELLTPVTNQRLGLVWTTVPPHFSTQDTPMTHPGDEVFLVLKGELELYLDGRAHRVRRGDTISFDSTLPHAYANPTGRVAVFLGCSTPPTTAACYSFS
ncbi:MAG: cupin domain-containing protein [Nocardioidaceae bacterium]|nr:cupin domain-containing protein [Nocardioidaceae bacterium]